MSVIVTDGMSLDHALRLLWREANRENIPEELKRLQFREKASYKRHQERKLKKKEKRRRRSYRRRIRRLGRKRQYQFIINYKAAA